MTNEKIGTTLRDQIEGLSGPLTRSIGRNLLQSVGQAMQGMDIEALSEHDSFDIDGALEMVEHLKELSSKMAVSGWSDYSGVSGPHILSFMMVATEILPDAAAQESVDPLLLQVIYCSLFENHFLPGYNEIVKQLKEEEFPEIERMS